MSGASEEAAVEAAEVLVEEFAKHLRAMNLSPLSRVEHVTLVMFARWLAKNGSLSGIA